MKSLSQALPLYPQPSGPPAHSQSLVGRGFRTQQDTGSCFLPCCPFCLHFPPSPAEVPWSIIRALFCQHPQLSWLPISWFRPAGSPPALEEFQQPPAWRHPPPPPLLGAKLGKLALGDPCCQMRTQTSSAGLGLSLPSPSNTCSPYSAPFSPPPPKVQRSPLHLKHYPSPTPKSSLWADDPPPSPQRQ